ncbi:MAG: ABC-F family ATP-binding cassette domain-containing protein [Acidobacteria bacterium]|nr:ABC-F family ATP-binding cassette domain-containing protein [Acidobacteriota bacterium]
MTTFVGPNGAGKTTLLDIMAGRIEPSEGEVIHGKTVALEYYTQLDPQWDLTRRVREVVASDAEPDWRDARLLEEFWFAEDAQWAPVELLSGGERRRLQLVLTLRPQPNVLLLDEPTNDLDVDTLRVLENFLDSWPGALVVVSHDRAFLERTVDDLLLIDGGTAARVPGGLDGWVRSRRSRKKGHAGDTGGSPAPTPSATSASGRSTSTIRHEIRGVDKRLTALGGKSEKLAVQVADQSLDHSERAVFGEELVEIDAEVAQLEDRWLELNEELESR